MLYSGTYSAVNAGKHCQCEMVTMNIDKTEDNRTRFAFVCATYASLHHGRGAFRGKVVIMGGLQFCIVLYCGSSRDSAQIALSRGDTEKYAETAVSS